MGLQTTSSKSSHVLDKIVISSFTTPSTSIMDFKKMPRQKSEQCANKALEVHFNNKPRNVHCFRNTYMYFFSVSSIEVFQTIPDQWSIFLILIFQSIKKGALLYCTIIEISIFCTILLHLLYIKVCIKSLCVLGNIKCLKKRILSRPYHSSRTHPCSQVITQKTKASSFLHGKAKG